MNQQQQQQCIHIYIIHLHGVVEARQEMGGSQVTRTKGAVEIISMQCMSTETCNTAGQEVERGAQDAGGFQSSSGSGERVSSLKRPIKVFS